MESAHRQSAPHLTRSLASRAPHADFFQLVSRLLGEAGEVVEERALHEQATKSIVFRTSPCLGFPAGDVVSLRSLDETREGIHRQELTVNFLGLHGSAAPLPTHMLETAVWSAGEEGIQVGFNDFFSHRLIWLFYLTWRKYRYYLRYRPGAVDQFSNWMFSLIGIGEPAIRGKSDVPWPKLLTYLGAVAGRVRSAEMIAGVVAHAFALEDVSIREMETRRVDIPDDQRAQLGRANVQPGENMVIGTHIRDVGSKFTIVAAGLSFERFMDFLPSGRDFQRLRELVFFLLKDQLAWDLELHMEHRERPRFQLGRFRYAQIGWTTFIGNAHQGDHRPVVFQARR